MKWLWIIILVALALPAAVPRRTHRSKPTPRLYGDKVPVRLIRTSSSKVRQKIVDAHNYFRTKVDPPATNMLLMKWHSGLAKAAQRWANHCSGLVHDNATGLYLEGFGQSGQNIFISTGRTLWNFAIRMWYLEYKDFNYGGNAVNDPYEVGHYTQVVWATTHLVGCGLSHCTGRKGPLGKDFFMYVCNYAPSGNIQGYLGVPYVSGEPCSQCKEHCTKNKLCTNACHYTDLWSNCEDLMQMFPSWVCDTKTPEGRERRKFCGATCNCKDKIFFHHGRDDDQSGRFSVQVITNEVQENFRGYQGSWMQLEGAELEDLPTGHRPFYRSEEPRQPESIPEFVAVNQHFDESQPRSKGRASLKVFLNISPA